MSGVWWIAAGPSTGWSEGEMGENSLWRPRDERADEGPARCDWPRRDDGGLINVQHRATQSSPHSVLAPHYQ